LARAQPLEGLAGAVAQALAGVAVKVRSGVEAVDRREGGAVGGQEGDQPAAEVARLEQGGWVPESPAGVRLQVLRATLEAECATPAARDSVVGRAGAPATTALRTG
jgi:hypothetical protein